MSITRSEKNFYKKNGYILKNELISKNDIRKLNILFKKVLFCFSFFTVFKNT